MNNKSLNRVPGFCVVALFAGLSLFFSLCGVLCGAEMISCLKFFVYQFFCVFLPGSALYSLLCEDREKDGLFVLCFSYALGYALNVLSYFVTAVTLRVLSSIIV